MSAAVWVPRDVVERVRGPEHVDLRGDVTGVRVVHQDLPRRLEDAVLVVLDVELTGVVVDVDRSDAHLDRLLAEPVEGLGGRQRVGVGVLAGRGDAARADEVGAEDLGGLDPRLPARLVHVAVPAARVQPVLVHQRAVRLQAGDVGAGREAGMPEELDVGDALGLEEGEERLEALTPAGVGGGGQAGVGDAGHRVGRPGVAPVVEVAAVVEQLDAELTGLDPVAQLLRSLRLGGARPGEQHRPRGSARERAPADSLHAPLPFSPWPLPAAR